MGNEHELRDGLLATLRHSEEPMVLTDPRLPDNPIVAANAAFLALTGYAAADVVGRNCRFLQGARTDRETVAKMGESLRGGEGCVQWLLNYRRNGTTFWNLLFISPVFGADGTLLYFFANQHDLSGEVPLDLAEVRMGTAHMALPEQARFHTLLGEMGRDGGERGARSLESTLVAARQVAMLSRGLNAAAR